MASCVTCGSELHPERAEKYDYCTKRACQKENAKGLRILAYGVNKAADQYEVADGRTRAETAARAAAPERRGSVQPSRRTAPTARPRRRPTHPSKPPSWTASQQNLAGIYSARGMRPDEIAGKLDLPTHTVIQMILAARKPA